MKKKKEFMIIGLGQLGSSIVSTLYNYDIDLFAIDKRESAMEAIEGKAIEAVCADASKYEVLKQFEISSFDGAIVTIEEDMEASVKIIMHLKEMGMPYIMAKATSDFEGRIYSKVGADKVIFPDKEVGIRVAGEIAIGDYYDSIGLSDKYSIAELTAIPSWYGGTIKEISFRKKYGLNIIAIRRMGHVMVNPDPSTVIEEDDVLVVVGENVIIEDIRSGNKK